MYRANCSVLHMKLNYELWSGCSLLFFTLVVLSALDFVVFPSLCSLMTAFFSSIRWCRFSYSVSYASLISASSSGMCFWANSMRSCATASSLYPVLKFSIRKSRRITALAFGVRLAIICIFSSPVRYGVWSSSMPTIGKCSLRSEDNRKKYIILSSSAPNLLSVISALRICSLVSFTVFSWAISLLRMSFFSNF